MAAARSQYLLEGTEDLMVEGDKLPSNGQILRYVIFHLDKKKTVRSVASQLVPKLFESYDKVFDYVFYYILSMILSHFAIRSKGWYQNATTQQCYRKGYQIV